MRIKPNRDLRVGVRGVLALVNRSLGRSERAVQHYQAMVPWAPNRLATYEALEHLAEAGADPAPGIPQGDPDRMCFFIGYPRSGHSLVGALLDAHPEVVLAHELNFLQAFQKGRPPRLLSRYLRYNAAAFASLGRAWSGYSYRVPGQWQGAATRVRVLGDKKGAGTSRRLAHHPELADRLADELPWEATFLHVVRNPFDNIATWSRREGITLENATASYFRNANAVADLYRRWPVAGIREVHLSDFIARPADELCRILRGLGIEQIPQAYLDAATSVVFESPHKSRDRVSWPSSLVAEVAHRCESYSFLGRYTAEDELPGPA